MKCQRLAALGAVLFGAAAVSAKHLHGRHEHSQCPKGYTVSVYTSYSTMTLAPTSSAAPEVTSTSSPVAVVETPAPVVPADAVSTSSSTAVAATSSTSSSTSQAPAAAPTQATVAVVAELSTKNAVAAATTSSASSTSTAQAAASTSSSSSTTPVKSSTTSSSSASTSGEATFYGGNLAGGTCSYSRYTLPSGLFGTAFSGAVWDNAAKCGACVAVTGPKGNTIKAMVSQDRTNSSIHLSNHTNSIPPDCRSMPRVRRQPPGPLPRRFRRALRHLRRRNPDHLGVHALRPVWPAQAEEQGGYLAVVVLDASCQRQ